MEEKANTGQVIIVLTEHLTFGTLLILIWQRNLTTVHTNSLNRLFTLHPKQSAG